MGGDGQRPQGTARQEGDITVHSLDPLRSEQLSKIQRSISRCTCKHSSPLTQSQQDTCRLTTLSLREKSGKGTDLPSSHKPIKRAADRSRHTTHPPRGCPSPYLTNMGLKRLSSQHQSRSKTQLCKPKSRHPLGCAEILVKED